MKILNKNTNKSIKEDDYIQSHLDSIDEIRRQINKKFIKCRGKITLDHSAGKHLSGVEITILVPEKMGLVPEE